ncbi:MAG: hypothetical protein AABM40_04450 [Chloroflexota bacterium]
MQDPHFFDFRKGAYIFAFRPQDDFSEVKIVNVNNDDSTWRVTRENAYVGEQCIAWTAGKDKPGNAWLFSRGFLFEADQQYVAGIYYCCSSEIPTHEELSAMRTENHSEIDRRMPRHRKSRHGLHLRLGAAQAPDAMQLSLADLGIENTAYQPIKVGFRVPKDGLYFFSLQAHSLPGAGTIFVGMNGAGLQGELEEF